MSRTVNVVRMQLVNRQTYVWMPLIVLGGSFVLSLAVYAMIPGDGPKFSGAAQAPLWYFLVVGVQALTLSFPFSQAMSVTRREFYLGTLLTAVLTATGLALIFVIGGLAEEATNGWGLNGYYFHLDWIWERGPLAAGFVYFAIAMLFFIVGFWAATIYKRAGAMWLTVVLLGIGVLLIALVWVVGLGTAWTQTFAWFATQGALGVAAWGGLGGLVLAGISYLVLRRATP